MSAPRSFYFGYVRALADDDKLGPSAKGVAYALAVYANYADGREARPGLDLLARAAGCCRKTAQRALKALEASGWVRLDQQGRSGRASQYSLCIPTLQVTGSPPSDHSDHLRGHRVHADRSESPRQQVTESPATYPESPPTYAVTGSLTDSPTSSSEEEADSHGITDTSPGSPAPVGDLWALWVDRWPDDVGSGPTVGDERALAAFWREHVPSEDDDPLGWVQSFLDYVKANRQRVVAKGSQEPTRILPRRMLAAPAERLRLVESFVADGCRDWDIDPNTRRDLEKFKNLRPVPFEEPPQLDRPALREWFDSIPADGQRELEAESDKSYAFCPVKGTEAKDECFYATLDRAVRSGGRPSPLRTVRPP